MRPANSRRRARQFLHDVSAAIVSLIIFAGAVSAADAKVPDLRGKSSKDAITALTGIGFTNIVARDADSGSAVAAGGRPDDYVTWQSHAPGAVVATTTGFIILAATAMEVPDLETMDGGGAMFVGTAAQRALDAGRFRLRKYSAGSPSVLVDLHPATDYAGTVKSGSQTPVK